MVSVILLYLTASGDSSSDTESSSESSSSEDEKPRFVLALEKRFGAQNFTSCTFSTDTRRGREERKQGEKTGRRRTAGSMRGPEKVVIDPKKTSAVTRGRNKRGGTEMRDVVRVIIMMRSGKGELQTARESLIRGGRALPGRES